MKKLYEPGYILQEDEFLLKIWDEKIKEQHPRGFLTKLTQKKELPEAFKHWGNSYYLRQNLPIYVIKETFREGWKINGYRSGKSQDWAELIQPDGYTIEIYLFNFFDIIKENDIKDGNIIGKFMWVNHKLIKE